MNNKQKPRYEFRVFHADSLAFFEKMKPFGEAEKIRTMNSIYLLTRGNKKNNIKIRDGIMDIKKLESKYQSLEQWNPFLVGAFPLERDVIKTVVFPAMGIEAPVFEREKYSLYQFIQDVINPDPDLSVAHVQKKRSAFTVNGCIAEVAQCIVNGAAISSLCVEDENPEKVLKALEMLDIDPEMENVSYPLALKRLMGLEVLPDKYFMDI